MGRDAYELLWGAGEPNPRGRPPTLSRDRIVTEAVALADAEGLEKVSMKRVAERLDAGVMSLYRHVPGKSELIDLMYDALMVEPPRIRADQGWRIAMEDWAHALERLFRAHPWALGLATRNHVMGPAETGWLDAALDCFDPQHIPFDQVMAAVLAVDGYVLGALRPDFDEDDRDPQWFRFLADPAVRERFPSVARYAGPEGPTSMTVNPFEYGLQRMLDGLERHFELAAQ